MLRKNLYFMSHALAGHFRFQTLLVESQGDKFRAGGGSPSALVVGHPALSDRDGSQHAWPGWVLEGAISGDNVG